MNLDENLLTVQKAMDDAIFHLILQIQTNKVVDKQAFESLDKNVKAAARLLKGVERIPKKLLNDIRGTIKVLNAEAPYLGKDTAAVLDWAKQLEFTFDLILLGESPEDRVPGVPRII